MNILAIDTSGPVCGVAVYGDGRVRYEAAAVNRLTHSANLMPMIDEAFLRSGLSLPQMDLLACVVGPGSFTGVRIGVSTVKGLAHGAGKPCLAVDALEALAAGLSGNPALLCPIQDARAGQVYGAAFHTGWPPVRCLEAEAVALDTYLEQTVHLAAEGQALYFLGDGVLAYRDAIASRLGTRAQFAPAHLAFLRPAAVAVLAEAHRKEAVDYLTLQPRYLRAPQAERARAQKLEATGL